MCWTKRFCSTLMVYLCMNCRQESLPEWEKRGGGGRRRACRKLDKEIHRAQQVSCHEMCCGLVYPTLCFLQVSPRNRKEKSYFSY